MSQMKSNRLCVLTPSEKLVIRNRHLKIIFFLPFSPATLTTAVFECYYPMV